MTPLSSEVIHTSLTIACSAYSTLMISLAGMKRKLSDASENSRLLDQLQQITWELPSLRYTISQ